MTRADLIAAGWEPMGDHQFVENPLRVYLTVPVRDDKGCWFPVPMFSRVLDGLELQHAAERVAVERYGRKIARAEA